MNFIQLVCFYVLLKMFALKSHTKSYFETPFLIIFKYYAWVSCGIKRALRKFGNDLFVYEIRLQFRSDRHRQGTSLTRYSRRFGELSSFLSLLRMASV